MIRHALARAPARDPDEARHPRVNPYPERPGTPTVDGMAEKRAENQPVEQDDPTGGDETTEDQLEADNPVEEDTLKTLDPDAPPA